MRIFSLWILLLGGLLFSAESKIKIAVSIAPQAFFVQKIGGEYVEPIVLVPSGKNPEHYEPLISQMKLLKDSAIFFGIGLEFEGKWKERFLSVNRALEFVDLSHEKNADFHHREDSHIWLSLTFAREQAREICAYLMRLDSAHASYYEENLKGFLGEIDALDAKIKNLFAQKGAQKTFVVYHPAFEALAQEYGLEELAIDMHNKEAKIKHMQELSSLIKARNLKVIYTQPQFSKKQVEILAREHGLQISSLDPFGADWLENLWDIAQKIAHEK